MTSELESLYPPHEAEEMAYRLWAFYFNRTKVDVVLRAGEKLCEREEESLNQALQALLRGEPLQYVLGEADFYGLKFKVNAHVLIPRPETEELVKLIIEHYASSPDVSILDVGTGSACIAVSLKKHLLTAEVHACDVSAAALNVAQHNAKRNGVKVDFFHDDILNPTLQTALIYDVIVSNPPYVRFSEKTQMRPNVLNYEPELALFVQDETPLLFYEAIAVYAQTVLRKGGRLYFEINEAFGEEVVLMLRRKGFANVHLLQDIFGKDRIVWAER